MRVEFKGLKKSFTELPRKQRKYIGEAIRKSVQEGVSLARFMAPVGTGPSDPDLGRFKDGIYSKFSVEEHAFVGSIEVVPPTRDAQVKAI